MEILRATVQDLETVAVILDEAGRWLQARGINQWPAVTPRAPIAAGLARGQVYLAWDAGQAAGTLRLQPADPAVWGTTPGSALYVHSLAIRRSLAGRGLGRALLDWAAEQAALAGCDALRLDCMADNSTLCAYYEQAGFLTRGQVVRGPWRCALFEKAVRAGGQPRRRQGTPDSGVASIGTGELGARPVQPHGHVAVG